MAFKTPTVMRRKIKDAFGSVRLKNWKTAMFGLIVEKKENLPQIKHV